ncbi:L,D-transpeptidase family protein [Sphingomonas sp. SM33]|uniref:L,D-transpeptidase family protein n=1 Tax=Sphingomonas telluris TaxID=2907998 RepID=A0ABS9VNV6_9SPHN|nr:L,D-transpeptidase family protein [Sphingomonas telluris]
MGSKSILMFTALAALPAGLALAQPTQPVRAPVAATPVQPTPASPPVAQPAPQGAVPQAQPQPALPPPPPPPPPLWTAADANQLLMTILTSAKEGLDPIDYDAAGLIAAMRTNDPVQLSAAATERFNKLSSDLALGHVRGDDRQNWHIPDPDLDAARQDQLLRASLATHRVGEALTGLLPTHPQYLALRHALEVTPKTETAKVDRIRLNMDRWRWLPRDLGERYIIVNVPAYTAALVENGVTVSRHRAVSGAVKTPTPQLMANAVGVILNPWWEVPPSISKEVAGKPGYVALKSPDGKLLRWRQPPGPRNALGQIKFVMYNPQNIYLHDTTAKSLFDAKARAYSHGCIRTEHIMLLAERLLTEGAPDPATAPEGTTIWTPERVRETVASRKTIQANFPKPLPVYIVYMSSAALADGSIKDYADIYKKDGKVLAALNDMPRAPKSAAKPKDKVASR